MLNEAIVNPTTLAAFVVLFICILASMSIYYRENWGQKVVIVDDDNHRAVIERKIANMVHQHGVKIKRSYNSTYYHWLDSNGNIALSIKKDNQGKYYLASAQYVNGTAHKFSLLKKGSKINSIGKFDNLLYYTNIVDSCVDDV